MITREIARSFYNGLSRDEIEVMVETANEYLNRDKGEDIADKSTLKAAYPISEFIEEVERRTGKLLTESKVKMGLDLLGHLYKKGERKGQMTIQGEESGYLAVEGNQLKITQVGMKNLPKGIVKKLNDYEML